MVPATIMSLAPYAMKAEQSAGRRYPEPPHPYRNAYQRDRDRIIHARAFRRLLAKTQVFTRRYSDHFRSRLTHTLEVTQITRTIAGVLGLNGDLAEALALVHDIGHPPFGHAGERKLDELMRERGDGFNHNLHALRIVEHFEHRYAAFPGLNLTYEVREGIVKHSRDYAPNDPPELADYRLGERPPLEAQLIDRADEIAYNTADLDDGAEAHLFDSATVRAQAPLFAELAAQVERRYPQASAKLQFNETLKRVIDHMATDLIENTRRALEAEGIDSVEAVRRHPWRLVDFSPPVAQHNRALKDFLQRELYNHPQILEDRAPAVAAVEELFRFYLAQPERLPPQYFEQTRGQPAHRVVCDYIAGMTDTYLFRLYHELVGGAAPGPVGGMQ
jgi:dGTPase